MKNPDDIKQLTREQRVGLYESLLVSAQTSPDTAERRCTIDLLKAKLAKLSRGIEG